MKSFLRSIAASAIVVCGFSILADAGYRVPSLQTITCSAGQFINAVSPALVPTCGTLSQINGSSGTLLTIGNGSLASSATPSSLALDATYSNTAGSNAKFSLLGPFATYGFGLGVSTNSLDYMAGSGAVHNFWISGTNVGKFTTSGISVVPGTATPSGGTAGLGITFGTATNLGLFFGSGAPTLSAAQGSLYIRTDGSSTSTRFYINTNGTTGWTNVTSAT